MIYNYDQDEYIKDIEQQTGREFTQLNDIPDVALLMIIHIRGYEGNLWKFQTDRPKRVYDKRGFVELKY